MDFSIIIPTLNEENSILSCLSALQSWRGQSEIIVVDGGSVDRTQSLAANLSDKLIRSEAGRARQMNTGAAHAAGDIFLFLHADTSLPAGSLDLIRSEVKRGKHWGRFDILLDGNHFMFRIIARMMNLRSRLSGIATGDQAIFVTRQAFDAAGRYPEIALMEDIELSKALKQIGSPACLNAKAVTSARRWQKNGILRTVFLMWNLRLRHFFGADPASLANHYHGEQ